MDLDINKLEQELQGIFQERHAVRMTAAEGSPRCGMRGLAVSLGSQ